MNSRIFLKMGNVILSAFVIICSAFCVRFVEADSYNADALQEKAVNAFKLSDELVDKLRAHHVTEEERKQIIKDVEEQSKIILRNQNADNGKEYSVATYSVESYEAIEKDISSLGAVHIEEEEFFGDNSLYAIDDGDVPFLPNDTETVNWIGFEFTQKYDGKAYSIIQILAKPTAVNGKLYNSVINQNVYTESPLAEQVYNVYKDKLISGIVGTIADNISKFPFIKWLPYELLFGSDKSHINTMSNTYFANLRCNTTMMYTFVFNPNVGEYDFMTTTHYTAVNAATTFYLTEEDGEFSTKLLEKEFTVHSQYYDSPSAAIRYMLEYRPDFVSGYPFVFNEPGVTVSVNNKAVYLEFKFYPDFVNIAE